jgi:hypothetical protein
MRKVHIGLALGVTAMVLAGCNVKTNPETSLSTPTSGAAPAVTSPATSAPTSTTITYTITGATADYGVSVTYTDPTDNSIQQITATQANWSKSWSGTISGGFEGLLLQLSAQAGVPTDDVTPGAVGCSISINGQVEDQHATSGYNVAECMYTISGS